MDWSDEHYVKFYTRDTATSLLWTWQAVALFPNLLKRCNKVGLVEVRSKDFWAGLSAVTRLPIDVIKAGLEPLIEDGTAEIVSAGVLLPKFLEAQEARKTKAAAMRDHREKVRAIAKVPKLLASGVTGGGEPLLDVADCNPPAQPSPTPALPSPALPDPSPAQPDRSVGSTKPRSWHFDVKAEMDLERSQRLEELGLDDEPLEQLEPGFIAASLKQIRDDCGGDSMGILQLYDAYLKATWPAQKSPPYAFRVFAAKKVYLKLKAELEAA